MGALIQQLARLAGIPEETAREVLETARGVLAEKLSPEQMEKAEALLTDEEKAAQVGKLLGTMVRQMPEKKSQ